MLHYDEYGNRNNPTILLLHGAGALDTFCNQYCFSEQYHLIVPHLHGAGKSADIVYDPDVMKQELFEVIDSLHKKKIGIIGPWPRRLRSRARYPRRPAPAPGIPPVRFPGLRR